MKKTFKIVMLFTEKATKLYLANDKQLWLSSHEEEMTEKDTNKNQHLYVIEEKFPEKGKNEYYIDKFLNKIRESSGAEYGEKQSIVIATTDKSLVQPQINKDFSYSLPQLPESFIKAYIKAYNEGKPITEIDLEIEELSPMQEVINEGIKNKNHLMIPKIKTREDNTCIIHQSKMYSRDEVINFLKDWKFTNPILVSDGYGEYPDSYKLSPENLEDLKQNLT